MKKKSPTITKTKKSEKGDQIFRTENNSDNDYFCITPSS